MRLAVLLFLTLGSVAYGSDFQTTLTYCNGPVNPGDIAQCPSFSNWEGVELKSLVKISLPLEKESHILRLEDALGHVWEQDLTLCNAPSNTQRGCRVEVETKDPKNVFINVHILTFGRESALPISFDGQTLTIEDSGLQQGGAGLMFSVAVGK